MLALLADVARASTEAPAGGSTLSTVLVLLAVVAGAYLLTHFVVERAQQRFLFVSGAEYLVLGVVLGPYVVPEIQPLSDLTRLGPVFAFAAGWVGLLYGIELQVVGRTPKVQPGAPTGRVVRLALLDAMCTGVAVTGVAQWFFLSGLVMAPTTRAEAWSTALFLGCAAAAGSSSAVDLLRNRYQGLTSQLLPLLGRVGRMGDLIAILVFGVVFCLFHQGAPRTAEPIGPREWVLLTVGLGVVLGALFFAFLGDDRSENSVFLAMVGILLFSSGAAFFLNLSALLVNLILGAVLAQTHGGARVRAELVRTAKPASLVLLLFAGSQWRPVPLLDGLVVVAGYLALRVAAKAVATSIGTFGTTLRSTLFRGLLAQGEVTVAMALSFRLVYEGPAVDLAYTAVLFGVVLNELLSPRLLRGLLIDTGELREDLGPRPVTR